MSEAKADPRPRILIVDDDPAVREILSAVFRRERWHVEAASDGERAIALLGTSSYSAVVLDLLMPRLNGAAVVQFIKESGLTTPVIVLTALTSNAQDLDPHIVRVTLQKPFEVGELRAVVRAVIRAVAK